MRFGRFLALVVAGALAACGPQLENAGEQSSAVEEPNYTIGPDGAAGISAALPMDENAVRAAAPDFTVASAPDQVEGDAFTAITLSAGGEEVFRIYPTADRGRVHSVSTRSSQARGPMQDIVGVTLFGVAPLEEVTFCHTELAHAASFACSTAPDANFWRVYRLPEGYEGPSDPFDAIDPDVLHDATLVEMRWIASPVAP